MRKDELIELAKSLLNEENLDTRKDDLFLLKKEYRHLVNKEDENYFEKLKTDEFLKLFDELASKAPFLNTTVLEDKKLLIAKAKEILEKTPIKQLNQEFTKVYEDFRHSGKTTEEQDNELWNEMRAIKDEVKAKIDAHHLEVKTNFENKKNAKSNIIERAKKALELDNIKEASQTMDALMEEWKKVGFAGKECDESLWEEFSAIRKEFSIKRKEHFKHMEEVFKQRAEAKEELIKKIKVITADAYFTPEEVKQIKGMRSEYSKIGFAGKEVEDDLWERLNQAITKYFDEMKFYK